MSRTAHSKTNQITAGLVAAILIVIGGSIWEMSTHHPFATPSAQTVKAAPTTSLTYRGEDGKTALSLLEHHAKIQTKKSSLGEYVVAVNGNDGGGKQYWIFYVNGKEAQVGAGAYVTHNGDVIQWKLQ